MSVFGDGSDGALNVTSGTTNLPLNTKHQFTTVNVAAGATLSTSSTTGSVLYILARESITIDGTINVSNKVNRGNNTWSITIDGKSYASPGVAPGGGVIQSGTGYGGGGAGLAVNTTAGGSASTGGATPNGGDARTASRTSVGTQTVGGQSGVSSGGGSGTAYATVVSGASSGTSATATSGAGASTHGGNGGNGSGSVTDGSTTTGGYGFAAGGGGGGGGLAGRAGVTVVLKAPQISIGGTIVTAGTNGGNGGNGGRGRDTAGFVDIWAEPGSGGGGGSGGNVELTAVVSTPISEVVADTSGGTGGIAGRGGNGFMQFNDSGANGATGGLMSLESPSPSEYPTTISDLGGIASIAAVGDLVISVSAVDVSDLGGIASVEAFGTIRIERSITDIGGIASVATVGDLAITQSPPPPPPDTDWSALGKEDEKVYVYKVYDASGNYIGVWSDVKDDPMWTQRINTPGTTTTVILARSPNTTKESRDVLVTQDGEAITTEDGEDLVTVYESPNTVGEGSDVELNYRVDIYVHYGGFEVLTTQDGEPITTEDGEELLVASGAPLGVRVFSGYIMDYESVYGEEAGVTVTLASNGHELANEIVRTGETTTVSYSGTALETILKSVLDTNPGRMTYDAASIQSTGVSPTLKFQLNTKLEAVDSIFNQTPDGWYWYGNVGENLLYLKPVSTVYDHTFILGRHIKSLKVRRSIESIKNTVYFVGGETTEGNPATTKYKKYVDSTSLSQWRTGIERITDRRYIVDASMERRAQKVLTSYAQPIFTSPLVISAARYDIESIKLGQTVGFSGFGNFIDALPPLQIVSYSYASTEVTLELGQVQERQVDTLSRTESQLNIEQYSTIPTVPS